MIRAELRDDPCPACEARLSAADYLERHEVVFATGEFSGEPGTVIVAECPCGITSVIPFSVNLRRVA
jgi:hypothetical protein